MNGISFFLRLPILKDKGLSRCCLIRLYPNSFNSSFVNIESGLKTSELLFALSDSQICEFLPFIDSTLAFPFFIITFKIFSLLIVIWALQFLWLHV